MRAPGDRRHPRRRRIRKRPDFLRIQASSAKVSTPHLLFLLARASSKHAGAAAESRLGVVASRKVGNAVARNRSKRLVRELFRLHRCELPAGVDVVVIVRPGTHALRLRALEAELSAALDRLHRRAERLGPATTALAPG